MLCSTLEFTVMLFIIAPFTSALPFGTISMKLPNDRPYLARPSPKYLNEQTYKKMSHINLLNIKEGIRTHLADYKEQDDSMKETLKEELESIKDHQTRLEKILLSMADSQPLLSTSPSPLNTDLLTTDSPPSTGVSNDIISFDDHIPKYNIKFENAAEEFGRRWIFENNVRKIQEHNKLHDSGKTSYRKGTNEYSHLTYGEIIRNLTGLKTSASAHGQKSDGIYEPINPGNEPSYLNYVEKGAVNPVRNQRHCGSCWTFAAIGVIESQIKLKYGVLQQLSEQYLVDCDNGYYYGCSGGMSSQAIDYVKANGIAFAAGYQYTARDGICNYDAPKTTYRITSEQSIRRGNDSELLNALVNHGPISVAIYASDNFWNYKSGVFVDDECYDWVRPNHEVVLVGYGTENGQDYWLIRNSWGTTWGEEGYIKMSRSQQNFCQISSDAVLPMVNDNDDNTDINNIANSRIPA